MFPAGNRWFEGFPAVERLALPVAIKLAVDRNHEMNEDDTLEMLKYIMLRYFPSRGYVIDGFPWNGVDSAAFEEKFYPIACGLYFLDSKWTADKTTEPETKPPIFFRRETEYSEHEVEKACGEYGLKTLKIIGAETLLDDEDKIFALHSVVDEYLDAYDEVLEGNEEVLRDKNLKYQTFGETTGYGVDLSEYMKNKGEGPDGKAEKAQGPEGERHFLKLDDKLNDMGWNGGRDETGNYTTALIDFLEEMVNPSQKREKVEDKKKKGKKKKGEDDASGDGDDKKHRKRRKKRRHHRKRSDDEESCAEDDEECQEKKKSKRSKKRRHHKKREDDDEESCAEEDEECQEKKKSKRSKKRRHHSRKRDDEDGESGSEDDEEFQEKKKRHRRKKSKGRCKCRCKCARRRERRRKSKGRDTDDDDDDNDTDKEGKDKKKHGGHRKHGHHANQEKEHISFKKDGSHDENDKPGGEEEEEDDSSHSSLNDDEYFAMRRRTYHEQHEEKKSSLDHSDGSGSSEKGEEKPKKASKKKKHTSFEANFAVITANGGYVDSEGNLIHSNSNKTLHKSDSVVFIMRRRRSDGDRTSTNSDKTEATEN